MRRAVAWIVPLGLTLLTCGCLKEELVSSTTPPVHPERLDKADKPLARPKEKRPPKPETAVAFAELKVSIAETAQRTLDRLQSMSAQADDSQIMALEAQRQQAWRIQQESYQGAQTLYEQALTLDAKHLPALTGLARLHEKQGNFPLAIQWYQRALQYYPQDSRLWFNLGMAYAKHKQWDQALAHLKRATELEPTNLEFANNYAWCLARCERDEESWNIFRRHVGDAKAYYRLALMSKHLGKLERSRQYLTMSLQIDPQLAEARDLLANLDQPQATQEGSGPVVVPAGYVAPKGSE
jgi:tetratricopeptide (TPR) repeat protein